MTREVLDQQVAMFIASFPTFITRIRLNRLKFPKHRRVPHNLTDRNIVVHPGLESRKNHLREVMGLPAEGSVDNRVKVRVLWPPIQNLPGMGCIRDQHRRIPRASSGLSSGYVPAGPP